MRQGQAALGVALIAVATLCFSTMDTITRFVGATVPVLLILFIRYAWQAVVMTIWLSRSKSAGFRAQRPGFQLLRGALLLATSATSFFGVQYMPVAEFTGIVMITPVLVTLLAAWLLREHVSSLRWALVAGCFAGALVVIRPGSGLFGWEVLFPLGGALVYASFQVLTRKLSGLDSPYTTHFHTGVTGTFIVVPFLLASGIDVAGALAHLSPRDVALLALIGTLGTVGHLVLIIALGTAPASTLMPFLYMQIAMAAGIGWLVFRYVPDGWSWVGMAVIAACGAASAWLNMQERKEPVPTALAEAIAD
jgi:drug/metabolite transporter (DMT)-like permease